MGAGPGLPLAAVEWLACPLDRSPLHAGVPGGTDSPAPPAPDAERLMEATLSCTACARQYPVADSEFVHWKLTMEGRYPIDLGPLWSLIGAAR